jgi:hypothetical protein
MAEVRCLLGGFVGSTASPLAISSRRQALKATSSVNLPLLRRHERAVGRVCMGLPPLSSPNDPFLHHLASAAKSEEGRAQIADSRKKSYDGGPPLLDLVSENIKMMAAPAQVL